LINTYNDARNKGIAFVDSFVSNGTPAEKIAFLRNLPPDTLIKFQGSPLVGGVAQMAWQAETDSLVFFGEALQLLQSGNYNRVPLLIGSNSEEMSLSAPPTITPLMVNGLVSLSVPQPFRPQVLALYPPGSTNAQARRSYVNILKDVQFTAPARRVARCAAFNQTEPVWRYFFTHKHTCPNWPISVLTTVWSSFMCTTNGKMPPLRPPF
jgi:carboxylesterase type B